MLCRKEEKDPRKCLREGAEVTACGVQFLQAVKNKCRQQFDDYANCIDYRSDSKMFVAKYVRCSQARVRMRGGTVAKRCVGRGTSAC